MFCVRVDTPRVSGYYMTVTILHTIAVTVTPQQPMKGAATSNGRPIARSVGSERDRP